MGEVPRVVRVITVVEITKTLTARMELRRDQLPLKVETAAFVIKLLAGDIREMIRGEINEAKREWMDREVQR
jgi:hypothetical protein